MLLNFNPRAPCGARPKGNSIRKTQTIFQSTRPLRGATVILYLSANSDLNFNPRAPCGARHRSPLWLGNSMPFQSTRPLRGATIIRWRRGDKVMISIHAPLAGRDPDWQQRQLRQDYFNPRAPCGARRFKASYAEISDAFQSTRPLRGATGVFVLSISGVGISIHAPLAGRDSPGAGCTKPTSDFNPRAPCGARHLQTAGVPINVAISIHAPLAGRDAMLNPILHSILHFNPRAPCGARLLWVFIHAGRASISIHAPLAGRDTRALLVYSMTGEFQSTRPLRGATSSLI